MQCSRQVYGRFKHCEKSNERVSTGSIAGGIACADAATYACTSACASMTNRTMSLKELGVNASVDGV